MIAPAFLLAAALAGDVDAAGVHAAVAARHGRTVLVSFWATWCAPCVEEFPQLVALARAHKKDVAVIAISIDDPSARAEVAAFLDRERPGFPVYLKVAGADQAFIDGVDPAWSGAVPASLVFDAQGRKRALLEGEQTRAQIERALAGAAVVRSPPLGDTTGAGPPAAR